MEEIKEVMKLKYFFVQLFNQILGESDIKNIDFESQLEHQIQTQEAKESGWILDKNISMKIGFHKTGKKKV